MLMRKRGKEDEDEGSFASRLSQFWPSNIRRARDGKGGRSRRSGRRGHGYETDNHALQAHTTQRLLLAG